MSQKTRKLIGEIIKESNGNIGGEKFKEILDEYENKIEALSVHGTCFDCLYFDTCNIVQDMLNAGGKGENICIGEFYCKSFKAMK